MAKNIEVTADPQIIAAITEARTKEALVWADRLGLFIPEPITASWIDRAPWLEERLTGIGSSEIFKLFSGDPDLVMGLYLDKTGDPIQDEEDNKDMERGRINEPIAAIKYEELTGRKTIPLPLLRHPRLPWLLTDVDRLILPGSGEGKWLTDVPRVLEIKIPRYHNHSKYKNHGLSDRIIWQQAHHATVTGIMETSFCSFHADSLDIQEWDVDADPSLVKMIEEEGTRFYQEHVEARVPPPLDEVPVNGVVVDTVDGDTTVHTEEEFLEAAFLFREANPIYKESEANRKAAIAKLRSAVGKDNFGRHEGGGVAVTYSLRDGKVNWKDTVDAIADTWPLDSEEFKAAVRDGSIRNEKGEKLSDDEVANFMRTLSLDPYRLKVVGQPSSNFTPRLIREEED